MSRNNDNDDLCSGVANGPFSCSSEGDSSPRIAIYLYEPSDGGLDKVALLLARDLHERGAPVELWMGRRNGNGAHLIDPRIPLRLLPAPFASHRLSTRTQAFVLAAMVRRHRPDILYSAGNQSNMLIALACLGANTKAIARISNPIVRPAQRPLAAWLRLLRVRVISRLAAMTIVMGENERELLSKHGLLAARRVAVLPRPTVTPEMEAAGARRPPRQGDGPQRFLIVGRLHPQKDHATALEALALLPTTDWHLSIAGSGPLKATLKAMAVRLGLAERVEFLDYIEGPEKLAELMSESDLLLQPSRWEGMGASMIEALACGCGVVATRCTPNIVPVLEMAQQQPAVPVGGARAFAAAIERALASPACPKHMANATAAFRLRHAFDAHFRTFRNLMKMPRAYLCCAA